MEDRIGQVFDGVISGVTEWGIYVELNENKCEGMISIHHLDDDYYEFDEKKLLHPWTTQAPHLQFGRSAEGKSNPRQFRKTAVGFCLGSI